MTNERVINLISISIEPRWQLSSASSSINKSFEWILRRCVAWFQNQKQTALPQSREFQFRSILGKNKHDPRLECSSFPTNCVPHRRTRICQNLAADNIHTSYIFDGLICMHISTGSVGVFYFDLLSNYYNKIEFDHSFIFVAETSETSIRNHQDDACFDFLLFHFHIKISWISINAKCEWCRCRHYGWCSALHPLNCHSADWF